MTRIAFWLAALLCVGLVQAAPPQRNLSVEMRVSDDQADTQRDAQGSVTIGSRGGRVECRRFGDGAVRQLAPGADATQRVLVLNGGRASLRLAQGMQVDDTEVWWTPWGPGAAVRSQWVELVNGMEVQPRWPGGDAPVTLEIAAQSAGRATPNSGQPLPPQASVFTTVQVPMGEWVEVARLQGRQSAVVRRRLRRRDLFAPAQPAGARQPAVVQRAGAAAFGHSTHSRSGCFMRPACASAPSPQPQK